MDLTTFLIQCLNSVQYGLLLFLVASGLTLIFGIMGVINLAHGSFYMIGAYLAFTLSALLGSLPLALLVGIVLAVAFGYVLEWVFFSFLYEREHLQQVLMTYGLILVFEELRSLLIGDDVHGVEVPGWLSGAVAIGNGMTYPVYRLFVSGVCLALALGMYVLISRTRLGMMVRAGATNREMVQSLGINITLLYRLVFAVGVALAVFAGMIAAPVSSVYPGMGGQVLIICFVVVVIGGIGSIKGALIAAMMGWYFRRLGKKIHSSAIRALAIDSKNDVLATSVALIGVLVATLGLPAFDAVAGFVVAIFIFKGGYEIGIENIDYLMGKTPNEDLIREIKLTALSVKGVIALNTVRSHYVGQSVHVEIHIEVDYKMPTDQSHYIAEKVEAEVEKIREVSKAFVHVDPVILLEDGSRKIADFHKKYPHLD